MTPTIESTYANAGHDEAQAPMLHASMQLPIPEQWNAHHGGEEMGDIRMVYMHKHQTNPTPTLAQLELMRARAQLAITCTRCGTGNQGRLMICEGCRTVSYCSRRCQKKTLEAPYQGLLVPTRMHRHEWAETINWPSAR